MGNWGYNSTHRACIPRFITGRGAALHDSTSHSIIFQLQFLNIKNSCHYYHWYHCNDSSWLYDHDSYCLTVNKWYHNNDTSTVYSSDIYDMISLTSCPLSTIRNRAFQSAEIRWLIFTLGIRSAEIALARMNWYKFIGSCQRTVTVDFFGLSPKNASLSGPTVTVDFWKVHGVPFIKMNWSFIPPGCNRMLLRLIVTLGDSVQRSIPAGSIFATTW